MSRKKPKQVESKAQLEIKDTLKFYIRQAEVLSKEADEKVKKSREKIKQSLE